MGMWSRLQGVGGAFWSFGEGGRRGNLLKNMVGSWGLEPQTSTVSISDHLPSFQALNYVSNNLR